MRIYACARDVAPNEYFGRLENYLVSDQKYADLVLLGCSTRWDLEETACVTAEEYGIPKSLLVETAGAHRRVPSKYRNTFKLYFAADGRTAELVKKDFPEAHTVVVGSISDEEVTVRQITAIWAKGIARNFPAVVVWLSSGRETVSLEVLLSSLPESWGLVPMLHPSPEKRPASAILDQRLYRLQRQGRLIMPPHGVCSVEAAAACGKAVGTSSLTTVTAAHSGAEVILVKTPELEKVFASVSPGVASYPGEAIGLPVVTEKFCWDRQHFPSRARLERLRNPFQPKLIIEALSAS